MHRGEYKQVQSFLQILTSHHAGQNWKHYVRRQDQDLGITTKGAWQFSTTQQLTLNCSDRSFARFTDKVRNIFVAHRGYVGPGSQKHVATTGFKFKSRITPQRVSRPTPCKPTTRLAGFQGNATALSPWPHIITRLRDCSCASQINKQSVLHRCVTPCSNKNHR